MNTHEIVALGIVAVRLSHNRANRLEARAAVREFRTALHNHNGIVSRELVEANRAVGNVERKLARW